MDDHKKLKNALLSVSSLATVAVLKAGSAHLEPLLKQFIGKTLDNLKNASKLKPGDVVGVSRRFLEDDMLPRLYDHYGVYTGNDEIIHYWSTNASNRDKSCNNTITKTSFNEFLDGSTKYFILSFPEKPGAPTKIERSNGNLGLGIIKRPTDFLTSASLSWAMNCLKYRDYHLYTATETVKRAESKLGCKGYSLAFNNCEHFAIWCKTGVSESHQVLELLGQAMRKSIFY